MLSYSVLISVLLLHSFAKAEDALQKRFNPLYQMHLWSPWSGCSSACGPGVHIRYRGCRIGFKEIPVCPYHGHEEWPCYGYYCPTRPESSQQHQPNDKRTTHKFVTSPKIYSTQVPVNQHYLPGSHHLVQNGMATPPPPSPPLPSTIISLQTTQFGMATPPPPSTPHSSIINGPKPQNGTIAQGSSFPLIYPIINGISGAHNGKISPTPLTSTLLPVSGNQIKQMTPPPPSPPLPVIINGNQVIQKIPPTQLSPSSPTPQKVAITLLFPSPTPALITIWSSTVLPKSTQKSTQKQWITIPRIK